VYDFTDVSEEHTASIFRAEGYAKEATSKKQAARGSALTGYSVLKMEAVPSSETSRELLPEYTASHTSNPVQSPM
jgi:hypothetical protein